MLRSFSLPTSASHQAPAPALCRKPNKDALVSDCASDSTNSDVHPHKGHIRTQRKCKLHHRRRLFKLRTSVPANNFRLIQSIEHMLQRQAPVNPHEATFASMAIDDKRSLLAQLKTRVTVIEDTINQAADALKLLLQTM